MYELQAGGKDREARRFLSRQTSFTVIACVTLAALIEIGLVLLVPRFAKPYSPVRGLFPLMALAAVIGTAYLKPHVILMSLKKTELIGLNNAVVVLVFLLAGATLSARWGIYGLAAAYTVSHLIQWGLGTAIVAHPKTPKSTLEPPTPV
jgi:O-antigen/teichoic acid export membrane protein